MSNAKSLLFLNGENSCEVRDFTADSNVNISGAMRDSSKHLENFSSKENRKGSIIYHCDFDHMYASNMSGAENASDKTEIVKLKELLLLNLDLIQQQSEQLVTKDKLISALKLENDTLKQRLDRMDRRVTLKKHKEVCDTTIATLVPKLEPEEAVQVIPAIETCPSQPVNSSVTPANNLDETNDVVLRRRRDEKLTASSNSWCSNTPKRRNRSLSWTSSVTSADITSSTKVNGGKGIKRERFRRRERSGKKRTKIEDASDKKDDNILTTDQPYYTPIGDDNNMWNAEENPINGCVLEVPSWRVKIFTSCYTMEGTENLSDDVFDRRHSRFEIDERRRKRWDVQRIREQRQLEKLRQREMKSSGLNNGRGEFVSLWPLADEVQFVQVHDCLPVAAFGCPITKFNPADSEFTLPWVNGRDVKKSQISQDSRKKR